MLAETALEHELGELEVERAAPGIGIEAGDGLGRFLGHLLDVHAAASREHQDVGPGVAIDREAEVDLARDLERGLAVDQRHLEPLDVHADDPLGGGVSSLRRLHDRDAAGFAAAADRHLGLHSHRPQLAAGALSLFGGMGHPAGRDLDPQAGEDLLGLVLEQLHKRVG